MNNVDASLVFISPETLFVPNDTHLEIWKIPKEVDQVPYRLRDLGFPPPYEGLFIRGIKFHSAPNPYIHDMPYAPPRLFHTSADDGIIVISLQVMPYNSVFTIFIRRRSLLDIATKFSRTQAPASGTPPGDVVSIPWSEWGPPISRWLDTNQRDLTSSVAPTAVRWVLIDLSFGLLWDIAIYDFNPHNIYHAQEDLPGRYVIVGKGHTFDDEAFTEEFKMGLGCTVYEPPEKYDFDRVLVDEERMLGYKVRIWYGMVSRLSLLTLLAAER